MRYLAVVALSVCLLSCGSGGGESSSEKSSKDSSKEQKPKSGNANEVSINKEAQREAGILVTPVAIRTTPQYLNAVGQIVLNDERTAHVGSYTDGRVVSIMANAGDAVARGAVLARMHSHDVHETRAAYQTAKENVVRQQHAVDYQRRQRDRMERLYELKSASKLEVDKAEADVRAAENDLANAQISVQKEVAHLTDILHLPESAIDNLTEETEQVPVIAPISGTIVERKVTAGAVVEPGDEVFVISNLSSVWMIASVSETDVSKVHLGNAAMLLTKAFPEEEFPGRVNRISTELDPRTRTLPVRILVPNPEHRLKTQMYVDARILQGSRSAIFLNEDAIQDINGSSVAFVRKNDELFEARPLEIKQRLHGQAEVSAGLRPGEMVVAKGSFIVKSQLLKNQIGE